MRQTWKCVCCCVRNIPTLGQGETTDVIFWFLWLWICNSYDLALLELSSSLLPRTLSQCGMCPVLSKVPQLLFFILLSVRHCCAQSPSGNTCKYNTPEASRSQIKSSSACVTLSKAFFQNCKTVCEELWPKVLDQMASQPNLIYHSKKHSLLSFSNYSQNFKNR